MSKQQPIRGKVARILNSRELALNIGSENGVTQDMYFDVLDPKGEDIKDPDTGEILGSLERPKVRVKIKTVQPRLSTATTYQEKQINVGGSGRALLDAAKISDLFTPPKVITTTETLKTNEKTWEDLDEKESYVKTGDPVVQVIEEARAPF